MVWVVAEWVDVPTKLATNQNHLHCALLRRSKRLRLGFLDVGGMPAFLESMQGEKRVGVESVLWACSIESNESDGRRVQVVFPIVCG